MQADLRLEKPCKLPSSAEAGVVLVDKIIRLISTDRFYSLFQHRIIPDLRGLQSSGRHAGVQASPEENARAYADGCRDVRFQRIVVRVILLDHADKPLATE